MRAALRRLFLEPEPPLVAVEVRPRSIGVVRLASEQGVASVAAAATLELAEATLRVSIAEDNLADPGGFRATLRSACERAGVPAGTRVALVLPDPVARVTTLAASELTGRGAELRELVRFRLRKTLPFDVRDARIALRWEGEQVVAVAASPLVLDPYEAACRDCGLEPGHVELAGLALMDAVVASRPPADRLVVNWDEGYASLLLGRSGDLALVRTLLGPGTESAEALRRELDATLLYYRERLGGQGLAGVSLRVAAHPSAGVLGVIGDGLGVPVEEIEVWTRQDPRLPFQALAAAAASLLRRVA